jgi:hypothetical protein
VNILDFLWANWETVSAVAGAAILVTAAAAKRRWDLLGPVLFGLVTWAEREYGAGTGGLKLAAVLERVYPCVPAVMRPFVSVSGLEGLVGDALAAARERWEKNPLLTGTAPGRAGEGGTE